MGEQDLNIERDRRGRSMLIKFTIQLVSMCNNTNFFSVGTNLSSASNIET